MHRFFAATGRFAVRFRWAVVAAWVAATVLASLLLPSLASVIKENNTDQLPVPVRLPADMREGDWIEFGQIGAYSNALSSKFNGFYPDTYVQVDDDAMAVE